MTSSREPKTTPQKPARKLGLTPGIMAWDLIAGLPAGVLIFMTSVLLTTLFSQKAALPTVIPLIFLALAALGVGLLAGISRLRQGPATGLMAGLVVAVILGYLWLAARPGDDFNPLVIGLPGMLFSIVICPIGGWLGARIRKAL